MEKQEKALEDLQMNEETIAYFIKGLRIAIKKTGMTQTAFAAGVPTSQVNLSNILNGKTGTSEEMRESLAKRAGMDVAELVLLGKSAENSEKQEAQKENTTTVQIGPTNYVDVDNFVSAAWAIAAQYRRADDRQKWWKEIFDMLPNPALVIRDGLVVAQNQISRAWGLSTGLPLCDTCVVEDCPGDACPLKVATESMQEASLCLYIKGDFYKVFASPMRYGGHEYMIVTATEINEFREKDRRIKERRE